MKKFLILNY